MNEEKKKIRIGGKGITDFKGILKYRSPKTDLEKVTNGDAQSWWEPF